MKRFTGFRTFILSTLLALIGLTAQPIQPAYAWALNCTDPANLAAMQIDQAQCESLESIYDNLGGGTWDNGNTGTGTGSWGEATDVNTWYGVTSAGGNVTSIILYNNDLTGSIDAIDLTGLISLEFLNFSSNQIGGDIAGLNLTGLNNLEYLTLNNNQIGGNIDGLNLTGLASLETLDLSYNPIAGNIDGLNLTGLSNLEMLRVRTTQVGGDIGSWNLGSFGLSSLEFILLNENQIGGNIDGLNLTGLSNLEQLSLSYNQIGGSIDGLNLAGLISLERLWLHGNQIGGDIAGLNLTGLNQLQYLFLHDNQITGDPSGMPVFPASLQRLGLGTNQLNGTVPDLTGTNITILTLCGGTNVVNPTGITATDNFADTYDSSGWSTASGCGITNMVASAACNINDLEVTITTGDGPFDITGTAGLNLPQNGVHIGVVTLTGPSLWTDLTVTETTDDLQSSNLGDFSCQPLVAAAACNGSDLDVTITTGDGPFNLTGTGPDMPQNGVGIATHTLTGPSTWIGVTVTETMNNLESTNLGDFTCGPEIDVQHPAGTSIADGGNDLVGAQVVGMQTLTYTIDNTAGTADLTIPAGGVTATNQTNVSGFTVNTGLPLTVAAGATTTLQIQFNIDAAGAFSFDLDIVNDDADENPYNIAVSGTGTDNLTASAACNGNDLDVTITAGDDPFDITGTGASLPLNGVGIATHTLIGPDSWTGVTITETAGDTESANLGNYTCPPPVVAGGGSSGGGGSASSCNLVIDVEADHEVVAPGDRVMWTVRVTNSGSAECQDVQTYGTMPGEFAINSITPSRGNLNWDGSQYYRVELGTLAVNEQVTVSIDSLLQSIAAIKLPEGAAGQSAGTQICLTGYITDPVNDTDCVTLFPDTLPSTGGEPVSQSQNWGWLAAAGLLIIGLGGYALRRRTA